MTANLLDFDLEGLAAFCERLGEKRFRAVQLFRWIHQKGTSRFEDMTDLARSLGNSAGALPFTVLLDAKGSVLQRKLGETQRAELEAWARKL